MIFIDEAKYKNKSTTISNYIFKNDPANYFVDINDVMYKINSVSELKYSVILKIYNY